MNEIAADVVVAGGGLGGVAAALAVLRSGHTVILTEETDWLGGQMTAQAVPPDEHPWIEQFGCTRSYRMLRDGIRRYYRQNYPLTDRARSVDALNPGDGVVSQLCHEPRVAVAVIEAMLAPYLSSGRLRILYRYRPVGADTDGDTVGAVTFQHCDSDEQVTASAPYFVDATETGELLPLSKTEYVTGFESQDQTGEPHAPRKAQPLNMQAVTVCFALDYLDGEDHTIDRPDQYDYWRSQQFPQWPGPQLSWTTPHPDTHQAFDHVLLPNPSSEKPHRPDGVNEPHSRHLWLYRRIIARHNFAPGTFASDIALANWPMLDYVGGPLFEVDDATATGHFEAARQLSLSLLHWLQTEAPRPDDGHGYPGLRLRHDIVGTIDGLAKYPYIRESRRIKAIHTIVEHEVADPGAGSGGVATYPDTVGVGAYFADLHPSTGGDNFLGVPTAPFEIPLGALVHERVRNLLPGAKNIGTTHITNGCYRVHPVEWNIGESAGLLATYCLERGTQPQQVREDAHHLVALQDLMVRHGVELHWPASDLRWPTS